MATAQKEPSQIQKDLLARRLVESDFEPRPRRPDRSDFHLPKAEELHDVARCQLCEVARVNPDFELQNAARATALSPSVETEGQWVSPTFADDLTV